MNHSLAWVLVGLLSGPPPAPDVQPLAASAAREVSRLVRALPPAPRADQPAKPQPKKQSGWIARHPKLFGALVGFGAGCVVGASQVGGSDDTFFNALDEAACPVVGGLGAGAGALIGAWAR